MKKILRSWFINTIIFKILAGLITSIEFGEGLKTLFLAALMLTLFEFFLKPILKILLLPINILTLGLLRWVVNVLGFYIVSFLVPSLIITAYHFPGVIKNGLIVPPIEFSLFATFILISFCFNLFVITARWVLKK